MISFAVLRGEVLHPWAREVVAGERIGEFSDLQLRALKG